MFELKSMMSRKFFNLKYRFHRPDAASVHRELMRNQYLSRDEIDAINWTKRQKLIAYAYDKVPFYRERFDGIGMQPGDMKLREDFLKIPILTKDDLRHHSEKLKSTDSKPEDFKVSATGGSTGTPVTIYTSKNVPIDVFRWRELSWWGIDPKYGRCLLLA